MKALSLRHPNDSFVLLVRCLLLAAASLSLAGCQDLGIINIFAHDQVPQAAHDQPRMVEQPPEETGHEAWPRLGDVPFKPKDFSPKPVYDHYMDELSTDRADAQAVKKQTSETPADGSQKNLIAQPVPPQFIHP